MTTHDANLTDFLRLNCTPGDAYFMFDCNSEPWNLTRIFFKALGLGIIILLTICGNVLVLMAVALSPNLRSSTHYLIVNLAVADLLLGTTVLPFSAVNEITGKWYFGETFCSIWAAVDVLYCTASILSLCAISLDRYIGVTRPLAYSTIMVGRRTSILMVVIWVMSVLISIGPLLGWRPEANDNPYVCSPNKELGYVLFSSTGSFYLPMLIILIVYWKIYKAAIQQTRFLESGTKTTKQEQVTLRIHLGGANGYGCRANSTPDVAIIRGGGGGGGETTPKNEFSPSELLVGANAKCHNGHHHHHNGINGSCRVEFHHYPPSVRMHHHHHHHHQGPQLAPLARPELSSSSSHNNEDNNIMHPPALNDPAVVLRVHRGGSKQTKTYDHWSASIKKQEENNRKQAARNNNRKAQHQQQQQQQQRHHHQCTSQAQNNIGTVLPPLHLNNQHCHRARNGSQPNSLTPSPPSSSPERKINPNFGQRAKFRRQKKAAKTLAIVVGVFLLCWFPFFFVLPLGALCGDKCKVPDKVFDLFFWLGYFNSCLNPFIYACTSREFQRAFRRILCRRPPPRPHVSRAIYRANNPNRCVDRQCNDTCCARPRFICSP